MRATGSALENASLEARRLYRPLLEALRPLGPFREEVKKTSVHLSNQSAFLGVHFRRSHLILTIKSASRIEASRIFKAEQVSRNRWHCDAKVAAEEEIDGELVGWIRDAYQLCA